jgi:hypothetical protein
VVGRIRFAATITPYRQLVKVVLDRCRCPESPVSSPTGNDRPVDAGLIADHHRHRLGSRVQCPDSGAIRRGALSAELRVLDDFGAHSRIVAKNILRDAHRDDRAQPPEPARPRPDGVLDLEQVARITNVMT